MAQEDISFAAKKIMLVSELDPRRIKLGYAPGSNLRCLEPPELFNRKSTFENRKSTGGGGGFIQSCALALAELERNVQHPTLNETGEGGIRTLGSLLGYGALAKRCFQPLSHLTKNLG